MLSFDNTLCAAQISARPKSSFPFHEKLYTYVSSRVSAVNISKLACHCLKYFQNDKIYVVLSFLSALECCKETKCFQVYKALQEKLRYLIIHIGNMYYIERFFVGEEQKRAADVTEQVPLLCLNHHHHFSQRPCQGI